MMMWTLVLLADFILEFRLEYLWPCWLFFGSVYTTFHCHGLVRELERSAALICVCFCSLLFCNNNTSLLCICRSSVLFSSALRSPSTSSVWFSSPCTGFSSWPAPTSYSTTYGTQVSGCSVDCSAMLPAMTINVFLTCALFVRAEKGICISTASLWILLVYTEASLRLKDLKTSHANLSHLFAAHWCVDVMHGSTELWRFPDLKWARIEISLGRFRIFFFFLLCIDRETNLWPWSEVCSCSDNSQFQISKLQ